MKTLKRMLASLMVAVMVLTAAPLSGFVELELNLDWLSFDWLDFTPKVSAASGTCGENVRWTFDGETGELTISGTGDMVYNGDEPLWQYCMSAIKKVTIEDGVTSIFPGAFGECISLTSVTIGNSVTTIGGDAFAYCTGLTSVTIGNSVTTIGDAAFAYCTSLTSVTIPDSVTTIGEQAFYRCENLKSVTMGDGITTISEQAFYRCPSLTSVTMGNNVKTIGIDAFAYCISLKNVTLPDGVTTIGNVAFGYCMSIKSVTIPDSVTSIGYGAFGYCTDLTSVTIEDGVTCISDELFYGCSSLTDITIPDSVISIGASAFNNCKNLTNVTIGDGVTTIGEQAFFGCNALEGITVSEGNTAYSSDEYGILFNKDKTELLQYPARNTTKDYILPDSVIRIGTGALSGCPSLESITVPENNTAYATDEYGVLYNKDKTELIQYPAGSPITSYTIPDSVTSIGARAFYDCKNLTNIIIGNGVTGIGDSAFYGCSGIMELTMPMSVIYSYSDNTFSGCTNIKKVTFTKGDGTVPDSSSSSDAKRTPWYKSNCPTVIIEDGVAGIADYMFYDCDSLTSVTIPDSVTTIGNGAFSSCIGLTSVTIPEGVTDIGDAFNGCTGLTSITVPDSVTSLSPWAFQYCTGLTEFTIPISAKLHNGWSSYSEGYPNLKKITLTKGNGTGANYSTSSSSSSSSYYANTMWYQSNCPTVIIEDGVTGIGDYTFYYCSGLTNIVIPKSVTSIGKNAFSNCTGLKNISYDGTKEDWNKITIGTGNESLTSAITFTEGNGTCGENLTWVLYEDGKLVISGEGKLEKGDWNQSKVKTVVIPDGVTSIGDGVFADHLLESITIPDSVTSIGESAFQGCVLLTSVTIPDSVTTIGDNAFNLCMTLTELTMPISAKTYENTFANCTSIEKITLTKGNGTAQNYQPDYYEDNYYGYTPWNVSQCPTVVIAEGVTAIGDWTFAECYYLQSVTIPDSVTSIGEEAFVSCDIRNLTIGDGITELSEYMFGGCWSLEHLTIGSGIEKFDRYFLSSCSSLQSITVDKENKYFSSDENGVLFNKDKTELIKYPCRKNVDEYEPVDYTIPDGVKVIGEYAFDNAYITSVTIGDGVTSIGDRAFWYCENLTSVTIPDSVTSIGYSAFYNCYNLISATVGDGVTKLGDEIFGCCNNLEYLTLGSGVAYFDKSAVYDCDNLKAITVDEENKYFSSDENGILYNKDKTKVVFFPPKSVSTTYVISESVTELDDQLFENYEIERVTVAENNPVFSSDENGVLFNKDKTVLYYYPRAKAETSYTIPDGVTSVGDNAFAYCNNLTSITIPDSLTTIVYSAFYGCYSLENVYYTGDVAGWCAIRFSGYNSNPMYYADNLYINGELVTELVIPDGVTSIGNYAFYHYTGLTSVTIPDSVTTIGYEAFYNCYNLTEITIPDSITELGQNAFYNTGYYNDDNNWENGVFYIGSYLIKARNVSGDYTIKDGTKYIADDAFSWCDDITSITIPDSVTTIGGAAFFHCEKLEKVTIGNGVTYIGAEAFESCGNLADITIGNGVTYIGRYAFLHTAYKDNPENWENGMLYIGEYLIGVDDLLKECIIRDGTRVIADEAFAYCSDLTEINIPASVIVITDTTFIECLNIKKITVDPANPAFVTDENGVLYNKDKTAIYAVPLAATIENFIIPASVSNAFAEYLFNAYPYQVNIKRFTVEEGNPLYSSDEYGVLYNNDKTRLIRFPSLSEVTHYTVPSTVEFILSYSFCNSNNLTNVVISEGVGYMEAPFIFCENLRTVTIPSTLTELSKMDFIGCINLEKITVSEENPILSSDGYGALYNKDRTYLAYVPPKSVTNGFVMPDSVREVMEYAFIDCRDFSLTLSDFLETDGFFEYTAAKEFIAKESNPYITTIDGVLYNKDVTLLYKYPVDSDRQLLMVPETVTEIDSFAFFSYSMMMLFLEMGSVRLDVSDYSPYRIVEGLTVHASNASYDEMAGPDHVYVEGWTAEEIEYVNAEIQEIVQGMTLEYEEMRSYYPEDSTAYKIYSEMMYWFNKAGINYVLCDGDHTQLHPVGHEIERVEPGCGVDGYLVGYCEICDVEFTAVLKADEHEFEITEILPTCTQTGLNLKKCTSCGYEEYNEVVPATGHDHQVTETPADCTVAGKKVFTCHCGDTYTIAVPATGHDIDYYCVESTCKVKGYECYKCTVCGKEFQRTDFELAEHTPGEWVSVKDADCTEEGLKEKHCTVCGELVETQVVPATGHSCDSETIKEPTCSEEGLIRNTCSVCGDVSDEVVPATGGHELQAIRKEPTCIKVGTEQYMCKHCLNMVGDVVILPKTSHSYSEWSVKAPTATEAGSKTHSCVHCGTAETVTLPAIGFETTEGVVIDFATNVISGVNSGEVSLESYTTTVSDSYVWEYETQNGRLGTGSKAMLKDSEDVISEYTILIFGDVNGDGWYDGQDAVLVSCLANGMLTQDDVSEAVYTAADCNHDGVIDDADVALLNEAGTLLANVDQSKPAEVLLQTSSAYVEYLDLIDQTFEIEVEDETDVETEDTPEADVDTTPEQDEIKTETSIFEMIINFIKSIFEFFLTFIPVPYK